MKRITIGLALGAVIGFVEAVIAIVAAPSPTGTSQPLLVGSIVWAALGAVLATIPAPAGLEVRDADAHAGLRVLLGLVTVAVVGHVNARLLMEWDHLGRLMVTLALVIPLSALWMSARRSVSADSLGFSFRWVVGRPLRLLAGVALACALLSQALGGEFELSTFSGRTLESSRSGDKPPRLMVLGIDSATWRIVTPLVEEGGMPNLASLIRRGTWGVLRSYEDSHSPTVWTSIMTGKDPDQHGVVGFAAATAINRRAKSVWQIATELNAKSAVINVPGTYPELGDSGVMLSGFPLPGRTRGNLGWFATTGEPATVPGIRNLHLSVAPESLAPGQSTGASVVLRDLPASFDPRSNAILYLLEKLGGPAMETVCRAALAVRFAEIELTVTRDGKDDLVVTGHSRNGKELLFSLRRGDWSEWLLATNEGRSALKVRFVDGPADELSLFLTPLFPFPERGRARPHEEISELLESPYVAEPVGWSLFSDARLIETFHQHLLEVAENRVRMGLTVLDRFEPDLFIYVFTATDRLQHPLMKFMYPEAYERYAHERGGPYEEQRPTPALVASFGEAIPDLYRQVDGWIGEFLERAGPETHLVVVSDHGAQPGLHSRRPTAGNHHPDGIYVVSRIGPEVVEPKDLSPPGPVLVIEDIGPILLHLLGAPVGEDMKGRVPPFVVESTRPVETVASYEDSPTEEGARQQDLEEVQEQLRALGYID